MITAPTEPTAHDPSRQSARRSNSSSSARNHDHMPPVFSDPRRSARLSASFAIRNFGPPEAQPNHTANINRKYARFLNPGVTGYRIGFPSTVKTLYDGGRRNISRNRARIRMTGKTGRTSLTVVLAAGEGTRMRSSLPKVLHPVAGQSLLAHVLGAAPKGPGAALAVVVGADHAAVEQEIKRTRADAGTFVQRARLGTAHAVLAAREAIARGADDLLVVFGDTPLISAATSARLRAPP